jgi:hypothetical protein
MDHRWGIYIDIEGFSYFYPEGDNALWALNKLMLAIHRIGKKVFPEPPERLFAHQLGDGFLITSDFHEENLDRAASIATLLMKFITSFGVFARGTIVEGGLSGITGCYPEEVMNECEEGDWSTSKMGAGLMTIFPVMGTALINAVGIAKRTPKGPLLIMPLIYKNRLSTSFIMKQVEDNEIIAIDWVHTESALLSEIKEMAHLECPCPENLEILLKNYISKHKLPPEWSDSCQTYLSINLQI